MNEAFKIAVIIGVVLLSGYSLLGFIVMARVLFTAIALRKQFGHVPQEIAQKQAALNNAQASIAAQQKELAEIREALINSNLPGKPAATPAEAKQP